jgi:ATP-binding cassette, subfamily F, member 3
LVADRLWLTADGHIKPFTGDMEDYARFVLDRARVAARAPSQNVGGEASAAQTPLTGDEKAAQDARDAARKAAKKRRRRGH